MLVFWLWRNALFMFSFFCYTWICQIMTLLSFDFALTMSLYCINFRFTIYSFLWCQKRNNDNALRTNQLHLLFGDRGNWYRDLVPDWIEDVMLLIGWISYDIVLKNAECVESHCWTMLCVFHHQNWEKWCYDDLTNDENREQMRDLILCNTFQAPQKNALLCISMIS